MSGPEHVGSRIKRAYLAAGLNRNQFSKRLGTVYHNVIRWESGAEPGLEYLEKIAEITGVTLEWLIKGDEPSTVVDEGARAAIATLIATWDPRGFGPPPDDEEQAWLGSLDLSADRRAGLEITPSLVRDRLVERRAQARQRRLSETHARADTPPDGARRAPRELPS